MSLSPLPLRLALRELRGGLKGFYIFLACIVLGVAAIAGVGSFAAALQQGLKADGQAILGGDVGVSLIHRQPTQDEAAYIASLGETSLIKTTRAIARTADGTSQTLVEIKAVDGAYPLYGTLAFRDDDRALPAVLAGTGGLPGIAVEETFLATLGVEKGDEVLIGNARFVVAAVIADEPDRLSGGFNFGPRVMMTAQSLDATGLIQPGSLIRYHIRVRMNDPSDAALEAARERLETGFPDAGWRVNTRDNAAPRLAGSIDRFSQFLTLVALTALIVGGVGVGNAVNAYLATKIRTIASLKAVGATARTVALTYGFQLALIALGAIALGLAIGAALPPLAGDLLRDELGLDARFSVYPAHLALAAVYGAAITLIFALWPLGRTARVKPTALFRDALEPEEARRPGRAWLIGLAAAVAALCGLVILFTEDTRLALIYIASVAAGIFILRGVAFLIMAGAARVPSPANPRLRLALRNLHRPGAPTPAIVLSLGLGLALLVTLALIDTSITRQLTANIPEKAPNFFFLDIPRQDEEAFIGTVMAAAPEAEVATVPMLRGRITAINGVSSEDYPTPNGERWVISEDRGLTYRAELPENGAVTQGEWWPADTTENLISFDDELGRALNLKLGDEITVNVLGRDVTARIANFRSQEWDDLSITFVMQFSPATFAGAPHMVLATVTLPTDEPAAEQAVLRQVIDRLPTITAIPVRGALEFANGIVRRLATAVRAASGVTLLTSLLVLAGAFAAGYQGRVRDAMILKTLGATRADVLKSYILEYLLLGVIAAVFGVLAGMLGAWAILTFIMQTPFVFAPIIAGVLAWSGLVLTLGVGLFTSWRALSQRPAAHLRNL